jgi:hypothetical protein
MDQRSQREAADRAELARARAAGRPPVVTAEDLEDVIDVDAVDEYVAETGEYPLSGDLAEGDVADETIIPEIIGGDPTLGGLGADIDAMPGLPSDGRAKGPLPKRSTRKPVRRIR